MEKRILPFIILSMAVLLGFQSLYSWLNPPPPVVAKAKPAADEAADGPTEAPADAPAESPADAPPAVAEVTPGQTVDAATESAATPDPDATAARPAVAPQWFTLGSLDPNSPYRMLVWLNNRGGAIECIALSNPRFTDLDNMAGYLGHLSLTDEATGGCRINAVGPGTPAAAAQPQMPQAPNGLQPGDVIVQFNERPVASQVELHQQLERTRPGRTATLVVRRQLDARPQDLTYTVTLARHPLEVIQPEPPLPTAAQPQHPLSYLMTLAQVGTRRLKFDEQELPELPSLTQEYWQAQAIDGPDGPGVEFSFDLGPAELQKLGLSGPLRIVKRFRLARIPESESRDAALRTHHLTYDIEIHNRGSQPLELSYRVDGPTGLPLEGWWYTYKTHPTKFGSAGVRDVVSKAFGGHHKMFSNPQIVKRLRNNPENPRTPMYEGERPRLQYCGVDAQYFVSALVADVPPSDDAATARYAFDDAVARAVAAIDTIRESRTDVSFQLTSPVVKLPAGGQHAQQFLVFAGPKQPKVLAQYGLDDCITYGWFPWVAKPLTWILHACYSVFRNYGIAIILLTVLVRGCMSPVGLQQARNAQKMQELAPEMKKIADQYKNDMEKRAAAQRELFRKHNYNPLAGCLPLFIQLPIFIGLYRALSVDIELRQAALIPGLQWCSNLAGPDKLWYWENLLPKAIASPVGWLGPYLNILPLISVVFMMVHQKMFTPPPTDEQQQMQHTVMKFMMVFFGFMFFKVPAGLCLYFITSSAWGLAERMLLPKLPSRRKPSSGTASTGGNGASAAAERKKSKPKRR